MPGPFTHIYTARRVRDFLANGGVTADFIRNGDDPLGPLQALNPDLVQSPADLAAIMDAWPKFVALGANGPDLFFFLQDYADPKIPCDEIMLAMSLLYFLDDESRLDGDQWDALLTILAEISGSWAAILRFIVKLDVIWQKFLDAIDDTIGPLLDAVDTVLNDLSGGLLSALGDAFTELKNDIINLAAEEILTSADLFSWFALKLRSGYDEQSFLWSDMLHYRRTSEVPARLLQHAREMRAGDGALDAQHADQLTAFALGWITHVGTDTIAHSFVNEQAGGPFRTHFQRHHLVENHLDAWNYDRTRTGELPADPFVAHLDTYESLADSALYFAVQIPQGIDTLPADQQQGDARATPLPQGNSRVARKARKKALDTDGALPLWMAETIVKTLIEVYANPKDGGIAALQEEDVPHPRNLLGHTFQDGLSTSFSLLGKWLQILGVDNAGMAFNDLRKAVAPDPPFPVPEGFPLPWEVQAAYRFMLSWFKRSYVATADMDMPEPPTIFTPPASDFNFGPPDFSGVGSSDDPVSEACSAIAALLDWLAKSLEQVAQTLYDIAKSIASGATYPVRLGLYEGVILPAWTAAEHIRLVLVHLGYLMPQCEQHYADGNLKRPNEIDRELITIGHTVDLAFQQALQSAWDPLGNLDKDPSLLQGTRDPVTALYPWLPVRELGGPSLVEFRRPWGYPDHNNEKTAATAGNYLETPLTTSGPYGVGTTPDELFRTDQPVTNEGRRRYEGAGCPADTDMYNKAYVQHDPRFVRLFGTANVEGHNPLGDPVVFCSYLIGQISSNSTYRANFNLDADRGYGYLCWDWVRNPEAFAQNQRGQKYPAPVTWPEGAAGKTPPNPPDPTVAFWQVPPPVAFGTDAEYGPPLQLRYQGRQCVEKPADGNAPGGPPR